MESSLDTGPQAAEDRLRCALDASGTGTFRWDVETRRLEWDDNFERLFGLCPGTARSADDFMERVHPDEAVRHASRDPRRGGATTYQRFRFTVSP